MLVPQGTSVIDLFRSLLLVMRTLASIDTLKPRYVLVNYDDLSLNG